MFDVCTGSGFSAELRGFKILGVISGKLRRMREGEEINEVRRDGGV